MKKRPLSDLFGKPALGHSDTGRRPYSHLLPAARDLAESLGDIEGEADEYYTTYEREIAQARRLSNAQLEARHDATVWERLRRRVAR